MRQPKDLEELARQAVLNQNRNDLLVNQLVSLLLLKVLGQLQTKSKMLSIAQAGGEEESVDEAAAIAIHGGYINM